MRAADVDCEHGHESADYATEMRVLGVLIVILGVATVVLIVVMRTVVGPALRRRHIEQLERENERLDRLLDQRDRQENP